MQYQFQVAHWSTHPSLSARMKRIAKNLNSEETLELRTGGWRLL
jgi:hypothetical protein